MGSAPKVAQVMAAELGKDESWQEQQISAYTDLARGYTLEVGSWKLEVES